jgi:hypothetical protein
MQEVIENVQFINWQLKGGIKKEPSSYTQKIKQVWQGIKDEDK